METFGLITFMINPCLNKAPNDLLLVGVLVFMTAGDVKTR